MEIPRSGIIEKSGTAIPGGCGPQDSLEVLAVGNSLAMTEKLEYELFRQGFDMNRATTYAQTRRLMDRLKPDVVLIDAAFSDEPAVNVCRLARIRDPEVVIIMLADDVSRAKLPAFEAGADDYLTAPFVYRELVARMNAKLKRSRRFRERKTIKVDDLRIDLSCHEASFAGHKLALRPKEFAILAALASSPGTIWTRPELAREVWWPESVKSLHTIDVHVHGTRVTLARHSSHEFIQTVHGVGFCFVPNRPG